MDPQSHLQQQAEYFLRHRVAATLDMMVRELAHEVAQGSAPADAAAWMQRWLQAQESQPPLPVAPAVEPPLPSMGYEKGDCLRWLAAAAAAPPGGAGQPRQRGQWKEYTTPAGHPRSGMVFYVSTETGEKRWDKPPEFAAESPQRAAAGGGSEWEAVMSGDGRMFWHNKQTKQKTWDRPPGAPEAPPPPSNATNPTDWQCFISDKPGKEGRKWWYNARTGEKAWQCPPGVNPDADGPDPGGDNAPPTAPAPPAPAAAPPPPAAASPQEGGWEEHKTPDGRVFWYNRATKEKSWDPPVGWMGADAAPQPPAPPPDQQGGSAWQLHSTEKPGKGTVWFWYNPATGEKTWQPPPGAPPAPGAAGAPAPPAGDPDPTAPNVVPAGVGGGSEWQAHRTSDGRTFWYNRTTKEKTWDCPPGAEAAPPAAAAQDAGAGAYGWGEVRANDGRVFWYNAATKEKTWVKPAGAAGGQDDTPAAAAVDWEEIKTNDGRVFWYNRATKEKTWERPAAMP